MKILQMIASEEFIFTSLSLTIPILFAAMAALVSEKAGISNINIEGSMSVSALVGALISFYCKSWILGCIAGIATGVIMGMILSYCAHKLKTDSILAGIALNIFATGFVVFLMYAVVGSKGDTTDAPSTQVPYLNVPYLKDIPFMGVLFRQNLLFYVVIVSVAIVAFMLKRTKLGLRIKSVGFNPIAARSVGVNNELTQFYALIIAGIFAGLGGVFLSMSYLSTFNSGMVAGRGFIGLAAEAMGAGNPWLVMLFSYLFGAVSAFSIEAQTRLNVPYELLNTLPYLMTIFALILYSMKNNGKVKIVKEVKKDESLGTRI